MTLVQFCCIFFIGYTTAMQKVLKTFRTEVFPKTDELIDSLRDKTDRDLLTEGKIDGRMEVTNELVDVLCAPFSKKK